MDNMVGVDQLTLNSRRGLTAVELCCFFLDVSHIDMDMSITMTAIELPLLLGYVVSHGCANLVGDKLIGSLNTSMEFITSVELISNLKVQQSEKQEFSLREQHGG
ncbi:unnamed protein product [Sphagnum tenellum]